MRHGVFQADLVGHQRERALGLFREAMSVTRYRTAREIMRLSEHVVEISGEVTKVH